MPDVEKRVRYFNHQFLQAKDFVDEQAYHADRQQRHNRLLHTPGIADGLTVTAGAGATEAEVSPGTATDSEGRQIVVANTERVQLQRHTSQTVLIVASYDEQPSDPATVGGGGDTRWHESANVEAVADDADAPSSDTHVRLARLTIDAQGRVSQHDDSVRVRAGVRLGAEVTLGRLTLTRGGVDESAWPALSSGAASRVDVNGGLRVTGGLQADGNVGIGTDNPQDKLDLRGALRFNGNAKTRVLGAQRAGHNTVVIGGHWNELEVKGRVIDWSGSNLHIGFARSHTNHMIEIGRNVGHIRLLSGGGTAETMRVTGGRVGIGTADPGANLDVRGQTILGGDKTTFWHHNPYGDAVGEPTTSIGRLEVGGFNDGSGNVPAILRLHQWGSGSAEFYKPKGQTLVLRETPGGSGNWFNKFSIMGANVGIGGEQPAERLHVNGSVRGNQNGALRISTGNGWVDVGPKNSGWSHFATDRARFYFSKGITVDQGLVGSYNEDLSLQTSGTTRVTVSNSTGNVGIGIGTNPLNFTSRWTGSPDRVTNVAEISNDTANYKTLMIIGNKSAGGVRRVSVWDRLEVNGDLKTNRVILGGKWTMSGVGDAHGNDEWLRLFGTGGGANTYYGGFAAGKMWTAAARFSGSDVRQKKDIVALGESLRKLKSLNGVRFRWKNTSYGQAPTLGLVAQDVEEVFPELVEIGADGMKALNYSGLIAPMIEAVKEQQTQIERLEAEVQDLRAATEGGKARAAVS